MSVRRLALTSAVMAAIAVALAVLAPPLEAIAHALGSPQATVDAAGADDLVMAAAGAGAWAVWAWGVVGLALTALSAVPGAVGRTAHAVVGLLLPAGAHRAAAVALGIGLGVAAPVVGWFGPAPSASAAPVASAPSVPDWPSAPDAPADADADAHVVVPGDCLWDIAAARLHDAGPTATNAVIAAATQAWWAANADVVGPDPDLILPGQVLHAPVPTDPSEEPR